jgi:hypothetical protein
MRNCETTKFKPVRGAFWIPAGVYPASPAYVRRLSDFVVANCAGLRGEAGSCQLPGYAWRLRRGTAPDFAARLLAMTIKPFARALKV